MEIRHPRHAHPLFLSNEANFGDDCSICEQGFDGNPFYACVACKCYVHKSCAQLPVEIQHHFHQPHPLSLSFGYGFACDSYHKAFENELRFRCSDCDFDLDVKCALMSDVDTEGKEFIPHFTHQHPLTICSKDGDNPLNCFACKKTTSDLIYGCTPCDYFLHKSCAEISTHALHAMHPQHKLSLVVKFGSCNYCRIYDYTWKYYCTFCEFFWDISCLIESTKDPQNFENLCFLCGKQHLDSDSCVEHALHDSHCVISEIINVSAKNPEKFESRIVEDLILEDTINSFNDSSTGELLLDLLKGLDSIDKIRLRIYFPDRELFPREEEDRWGTVEQNSSSDDATMNLIEEFSFYNDGIFLKIKERLKLFKPYAKYHIQPDECELPVIEVEGYKVTVNYVSLFRDLLRKYGDFGHNSRLSKNVKSVLLYFLCRVLRSMSRTFVFDISENQLFTWLYYVESMSRTGFDLKFVKPFLERIARSYYGLKAIKFENEAIGRLNYEIDEVEKKISELKKTIEELEQHRQQHRVGKIEEDSVVMRGFFTEAKKLKWLKASDGIF